MTAVKQSKFVKKDLGQLAKLAKLQVSEDEEGLYIKQIGEVLGYVGNLSKLDLEGVTETNQVTGLKNVVVDDDIAPGLKHDEVMSQVPKKHDGYVMVGAIFAENNDI